MINLSTLFTPILAQYMTLSDEDTMTIKDFLDKIDYSIEEDKNKMIDIDNLTNPWDKWVNPNKKYWETNSIGYMKNKPEVAVENKKETKNMFDFGNMFNGMFRPVARGMCKMGANGKVAIRTNSGYKTFDIKKNKLLNCDNFAFDMDGAFWVVPTFKVECGDIILVNGRPRCVIEVGKTIKVFSYEDSTIDEVVPENHVFMGKTYCYGKIFSPFMNMEKSNSTMSNMMNMMMMSQMFNGNNNGTNSFNPMMFMLMNNGGSNPFTDMFEGAFNFGEDAEEDAKEE